MRDEFSEKTKRVVAQRVGFRCSNPTCRRITAGPADDLARALNIGVAAYIMAASPGGPRYNTVQSLEERSSVVNAVWLCQNCAKLVDSDPERFSIEILLEWKRASEEVSRVELEDVSEIPSDQPVIALYCNWNPSPVPERAGFLLQIENLWHSPVSIQNARIALDLRPTVPVLGLAHPSVGGGWFEDFHHVAETLGSVELHPGEWRDIARVLRLPGTLGDEPQSMDLDVTITANNCVPLKGVLLLPVWSHASHLSVEFAERTLILTNAIVRTDGLTPEAAIQDVAEITAPQSEPSAQIRTICEKFKALLEREPKELEVQRFFESNPILFHQFAPDKLVPQAPILTKYRTDFVLLSKNRELVLVELEAPTIRLLRADGHQTAAYTHAFQQVLDWLHEFEEYYSACLRGFHLLPSDVVSVQGVVIAGRDKPYSSEQLKRLKWARHERIRFYTYDDISRGLEALRDSVENL